MVELRLVDELSELSARVERIALSWLELRYRIEFVDLSWAELTELSGVDELSRVNECSRLAELSVLGCVNCVELS